MQLNVEELEQRNAPSGLANPSVGGVPIKQYNDPSAAIMRQAITAYLACGVRENNLWDNSLNDRLWWTQMLSQATGLHVNGQMDDGTFERVSADLSLMRGKLSVSILFKAQADGLDALVIHYAQAYSRVVGVGERMYVASLFAKTVQQEASVLQCLQNSVWGEMIFGSLTQTQLENYGNP